MSACRKKTKHNLQLNEKLKDFKMKKKNLLRPRNGEQGKSDDGEIRVS